MPTMAETRIHEVDFCAQIASSADAIFLANPTVFPFSHARVEGFGTGSGKAKRKDLRFFEPSGRLALCGEVKLPGTPEGMSPYADGILSDASRKADEAGVRFFFTWNVNRFVLWDRSQWNKPLLERRVREWPLGLNLAGPRDVARPEILDHIKTRFLPNLLRDLADIYTGRQPNWAMPPDDIFLRSLESHMDWPVMLTRQYMDEQAAADKPFSRRLEQWMTGEGWSFTRDNPENWREALDTASRSLAYVWTNRLIFYKALRSRFPELQRLDLPGKITNPLQAQDHFRELFKKAVQRSGDYETLLMPDERDWAGGLVFEGDAALDAWRGFLRGIEQVDFKDVRSDIVGRIFQKLISPEERHRYGQHFTGDDVVDLINAFCVRKESDTVLDPACGSGSFLVRAYYRKKLFAPGRTHLDLISELFGCDIAPYPAHLATLNLAAREINDEANYPRILRRDFFHVADNREFGHLPDPRTHVRTEIRLPQLDAIVGNPPYVRQESIDKQDKSHMAGLVSSAWPGLKLTGRADLHCYFWPAATRFLKPGGYFGFLTSSSWLDVEYGFALQGWALTNFKIIAVMESAAEPWFPDARVKTCVTILKQCTDEKRRMDNPVKFVRFKKPLAEIIGVTTDPENEADRLRAVEKLRRLIENAKIEIEDDAMRIILRKQEDLWRDGVHAGAILGSKGQSLNYDGDEDGEKTDPVLSTADGGYRAGKWGRYLRAPDIYFRVMKEFGNRFVPLGELVDIRFGVKTGCDGFFMPKDVSATLLKACAGDADFRQRSNGAARRDVESGKLRIIQDGAGVLHPIEAEYLAPEVHSLMKVDRPVVRADELDRVVLLVNKKLADLKGTWVYRYLKYGETADFDSKKSGSVPIPKRSTCEGRDPWYNLTNLVKPGFAFWPMAQQYRHIIPANPESLICNHNLFDLGSDHLTKREQETLAAVLNSTLIGLFKTFYGRFAGTEGNLKTEVVDVNLLDVPNATGVSPDLAKRLCNAFRRLCRRTVGRLVEEQLMDCHSPERAQHIAEGPIVLADELQQSDRRELDDAVFELLGVSDPADRRKLVDELYRETAEHFRAIRVVEIQKMQQRAAGNSRRFSPQELAADAWDAVELDDMAPLAHWVARQTPLPVVFQLPEERPATISDSPMFDPNTVYFGKSRKSHLDFQSRGQAELVVHMANLDVQGEIQVPSDNARAMKLLDASVARLAKARAYLVGLAGKRAGDDQLAAQVVELLVRWFVLGKPKPSRPREPAGSSEHE